MKALDNTFVADSMRLTLQSRILQSCGEPEHSGSRSVRQKSQRQSEAVRRSHHTEAQARRAVSCLVAASDKCTVTPEQPDPRAPKGLARAAWRAPALFTLAAVAVLFGIAGSAFAATASSTGSSTGAGLVSGGMATTADADVLVIKRDPAQVYLTSPYTWTSTSRVSSTVMELLPMASSSPSSLLRLALCSRPSCQVTLRWRCHP